MVAMIDIDDTLADTQVAILRYINKLSGRMYFWEDITEDLREGKDAKYQQLVNEFLSQSHLALKLKIYPQAGKAMQQLKKAGYELHIVSSRKENLHSATTQWLKANRVHHLIDQVHPRSSDQKSSDFKRNVAQEIKATVAFDDTLSIARTLAKAGVATYLIDKPWNQVPYLQARIKRSRNFELAVRHLLTGAAA